jgi:hypothetical protein
MLFHFCTIRLIREPRVIWLARRDAFQLERHFGSLGAKQFKIFGMSEDR